jgi:PIN domain nuclease of toxin-antitoxin system
VTVLDAFAVVALFKGEAAAAPVRRLIHAGGCALTTIGVAEVVDHLARVIGVAEEDAVLDVAQLGLQDPIGLGEASAIQAALLRARHYHRRTRAVSLADCVAAHAARLTASALATSDPHLLGLCRDERIAVIVLPDSGGAIWSP